MVTTTQPTQADRSTVEVPSTMRAAVFHAPNQPFTLEQVPVPTPRPTDVVVKVEACGIVPNLGNVLNYFHEWYADSEVLFLPPLPAVFGLDPAGVIVAKGELVRGIEVGTRVYVCPGRYCGGCVECRTGNVTGCPSYAFNGYFGFGPGSLDLFRDYPHGGLCEYMNAPQYSIVELPDNVSFETAARFGYLGTGYRALKQAGAGPRDTVLVNGASGTLGLGVVLFALAIGVTKVLAVARDQNLLDQVKALSPERIEVFSTTADGSVRDWARSHTNGEGASIVIDALSTGSPSEAWMDAFSALRRSGRHVNIGGILGELPINFNDLMIGDQKMIGSNWFTVAEGTEMAEMARSGVVNLDVFEHERYDLEQINDALGIISSRNGGFSNYVVQP